MGRTYDVGDMLVILQNYWLSV